MAGPGLAWPSKKYDPENVALKFLLNSPCIILLQFLYDGNKYKNVLMYFAACNFCMLSTPQGAYGTAKNNVVVGGTFVPTLSVVFLFYKSIIIGI